jgi:tRNA threonylcarbamoyladenosine biosynthesis protein TsaE
MVIHLRGNLGSGKTTVVRGVLEALGHCGRVKSPTYTLLEPYQAGGFEIRHFDLYRMHDEQEWESAGFRDELDGTTVCFIEWPDKAPNVIPGADLDIELEVTPDGRRVTVQALSLLGKKCLPEL